MEKDITKRVAVPFLVFLGFIALSINSLYRGIVSHETWRIALASIGGVFFAGFAILIVYTVMKNSKKTV